MHYYEPGDSKVTPTYSRNDDGEMELVQEHASEVYPDGGSASEPKADGSVDGSDR
jgi:hypothetical protein